MRFLTALLSLLSTLHCLAQPSKLIWEDNFDSKELNTTFWSYETGTGLNGNWGTGQIDRATDRKKNVDIKFGVKGAEGGALMIATRLDFPENRDYSSGRVNTKGKASWGPGHRIAARVYPEGIRHGGQGFAFWMMPDEEPEGANNIMWPQGGEIDIMEYVGSIPHHNLGGVHYAWLWSNNEWRDGNHGHKGAYYSFETGQVPEVNPSYTTETADKDDPTTGHSGFHVYGIDWYQDRIEFFVDDKVYHIHHLNDGAAFKEDGEDELQVLEQDGRRVAHSEYSNHFPEWHPFEKKMFVILSAGVGGSDQTYGGPIVRQSRFPCRVYVDWVRVYELEE